MHDKNQRIEKYLRENLNKVEFENLKDVITFDILSGNKSNVFEGKFFYRALV
jgi:hypothetical protein